MTVTLLVAAMACSSASSTVTSPTTVRCPVTLGVSMPSIDAGGGTGEITISVNRECTWEARSEADWITLAPPTIGQGDGALRYTASPNTLVFGRRGVVVVNDQRVDIAQAAATCRWDLSPQSGSVAAAGGRLSFSVTAQPGCGWTAVSQVSWLQVDSGREGTGSGVVSLNAAPNTAAARQGTVVVAGQSFTVSQASATAAPPPPPGPSPGVCAFNVSPTSESFAANGGDGTVAVAASVDTCAWATASNVPWISVATPGGTGSGSARYVVAANTGAARTGTLMVAGATVTVTQAAAPPAPPPPPACEFSVAPLAESFAASGGDGTVRVTTGAACPWTAVSNVPWISVTTGGGTGTADARYTVAANTGAALTGTLMVAGATVTVTQAAAPQPTSIVLRGVISGFSGQCPNLTFTLEGRLVRTTDATDFDGPCQPLRDGRDVTVTGVVQPDGSVFALQVRREGL